MELQEEEKAEFEECGRNFSFRMPNVGRLSNASSSPAPRLSAASDLILRKAQPGSAVETPTDSEIPAFRDKTQKKKPPWRALLWH